VSKLLETLLYCLYLYFLASNINTFSYYLASLRRRKPSKGEELKDSIHSATDPSFITILIPAYDEAKVIGKTIDIFEMVNYPKDFYEILIATYESDQRTREVVKEYEKKYPNVREVANPRKPPTTKAQNINHAYQFIDKKTEIVGFHDAEDVVSKNILIDANYWLNKGFSAVQFKVVPERRGYSLTERSYALTFAKTYNFIVPSKEKLGRLISSAGTATYIKKSVLDEMKELYGYLFDEKNFAEDFEFSLRLASQGYKIKYVDSSVVKEKFPSEFSHAVKQRSRWVLGTIQVLLKHRLGEGTKLSEKIGLMADYLGLTSPLWTVTASLGIATIVSGMSGISLISSDSPLYFMSIVNTLGALEEILITPFYARKEYSGSLKEYMKDILATVANDTINALAVSKALSKYIKSKIKGERIEWYKTVR